MNGMQVFGDDIIKYNPLNPMDWWGDGGQNCCVQERQQQHVDGAGEPSLESVKRNAAGMAGGTYFCRLKAGAFVKT